MTRQRYFLLVLILGALTALGPFSIDMYLPSFNSIGSTFGISTSRVSLSLSSFFLGISLGQILYGPLLERYGRKPPLYGGLLVYLFASAGCYFASSIEMLAGLRFLQALGSCAAGVVSITMVRDLFPVSENARVFSFLLLILGSSPMVAPTLGGFISSAFGWRSIFLVLFLIALFILCTVYWFLPETKKPNLGYSLKARPILQGYLSILRVPQFLIYSLGGSIAVSGVFAYVADSPSVFMEGYGVSVHTFGWIFAILGVGFAAAGQLNGFLSKYFSPAQVVMGCAGCMLVLGCLLLLGLVLGWAGLWGVSVMIFLFLVCIGIINPNAAALSMAPFGDNAGSAASLFGLIRWGVAGFTAIIVGSFKSHSPLPLALIMTFTAAVALLILYLGREAGGGVTAVETER